jgi:hypothetical protein
MKQPCTFPVGDCPFRSDRPRFVILNDYDRPERRLVAQWVPGTGYCYMNRVEEPRLKQYDGVTATRPTNMEDFGFGIVVRGSAVTFGMVGGNIATYADGRGRPWQDNTTSFTLPLIEAL